MHITHHHIETYSNIHHQFLYLHVWCLIHLNPYIFSWWSNNNLQSPSRETVGGSSWWRAGRPVHWSLSAPQGLEAARLSGTNGWCPGSTGCRQSPRLASPGDSHGFSTLERANMAGKTYILCRKPHTERKDFPLLISTEEPKHQCFSVHTIAYINTYVYIYIIIYIIIYIYISAIHGGVCFHHP